MEEKNYTGLVPENYTGNELTAVSSIRCANPEEAHRFYEQVRQRLLNVGNWHTLAGALSADFQLVDASGNMVDRQAQKNDYFRIDITGPGSAAGKGYDWAYVQEIKEIKEPAVESIAIHVHPAANPTSDNDNTAHFFSQHSSSTFIVTREDETVTAAVYDRNIEANEETKEPLDKLRNSVVGLAAKHGVSKLQWKALVDGLLQV